ncbi:MAG: 5-formyltetrahydrofolate cyclo-ligase [Endomicrobium sp.]|nr:5-formyltetrahydrofolate cyclo-ligase [Endomicrobium sp.]
MSDYLELEKKRKRAEFLSMRNRLDPALALTCSVSILVSVKKLPMYEQANTLMIYLSYGSEVITDFIIKSAIEEGKSVVVPAIKNPGDLCMQAVKIMGLEEANESVYGIRQPEVIPDDVVVKEDINLVLVPGLAFDLLGNRLGYGKGYYDRWLKDIPLRKTVGLAYDFQITNKLPVGKHDLPIGTIITEQRIIQTIN